jgi:hypothetical protein
MRCDCGIDKRLSERLELGECAFFVSAHQKAIAGNIRRQYSRQSPLYALAAQGAPPGSGKLNVHIAQLWADGPKWVKGRRTHGEHNKSASPLGADHTADVAPGRLRAKSGSSLLGERAILPEVAVDEKMTPAASGRGHFAVEIEDFAKASDLTGPIRWFS